MENERKNKKKIVIWLVLLSVVFMLVEVCVIFFSHLPFSYIFPVMAMHLSVCIMVKNCGLKWSEILWIVSSVALGSALIFYMKIFELFLPIMFFLLIFIVGAARAIFRKIAQENKNDEMPLVKLDSISRLISFYCHRSSAKILLLLVASLTFLETYNLDLLVYDMENYSDSTALLALIPISILLVFTIVSDFLLLLIGGFKIAHNIRKTSFVKYSIIVSSIVVPWILLIVFDLFFPGSIVSLVVRLFSSSMA